MVQFSLPVGFGLDAVRLLGDVSVALFGIFGIWLGLSYRDDFAVRLNGKNGEALEQEAKVVARTAERCRVLFLGFATSTVVFVFTFLCRLTVPVLLHFIPKYLSDFGRWGLKMFFFGFVILSALYQLYSLLASVAVMIDSFHCLVKAQDQAEKVLKSLQQSR